MLRLTESQSRRAKALLKRLVRKVRPEILRELKKRKEKRRRLGHCRTNWQSTGERRSPTEVKPMARLNDVRAQKKDVRKYMSGAVDTGTAGKPQARSSKLKEGAVRVESGGVSSHPVKGSGTPIRGKTLMKKVRVTSKNAVEP